MSWIVDPQSVSFQQWIADVKAYVQSKPEYLTWRDFYTSSAGETLIELMAGLGTWLQHKVVVGRRETFLPYMEIRSSAVARAEASGYSCDRGKNSHLTLTVMPSILAPVTLSKFTLIGTCKDADVYTIDNVTLNVGIPTIIPVVIGNLLYEDIVVPSSELQLFRFSNPNVTEDIQLTKGVYATSGEPTTFVSNTTPTPLTTSEHIVDLLNNEYVVITNTLDAVDVMYLNNNSADTFYYSPGDILRLEYIEAYDLTFLISDIDISSYGTIIGSVYYGTTIWASGVTYDETDYVSPTLLASRPQEYFFNSYFDGASNVVGEPYWNITIGGLTADVSVPTPAAWSAGAAIAVGDLIIPTAANLNGYYYKCIAIAGFGLTDALTEPVWPAGPVSVATTVIDNPGANQVTWACYNLMDYDTTTLAPISFDCQYEAGFTYVVGDVVVPTTQDGYFYACQAPGGVSPAEPGWPAPVEGNLIGDTGGLFNWLTSLNCAWYTNDSDITADVRDNIYLEQETLNSIKVNAPLYYESQALVRARDDFMKLFKGLDSRMSDTNYRDVTPAVVEMTYVRNDSSLGVNQVFNSIEKQSFITSLSPSKALGVPDPVISDPTQVVMTLNYDVYMQLPGSYPVVNDIDGTGGILEPYNLLLELSIDIFDVERQIEDLVYNYIEYIKKCVITIDAPNWQALTAYRRGDFVTPVAASPALDGEYIYECVQAGTTGAAEPAGGNPWMTLISQENIDDNPIPTVATDTLDGTVYWRCRQQLNNTTTGSTSDYSILTKTAWDEYMIIVNQITITQTI